MLSRGGTGSITLAVITLEPHGTVDCQVEQDLSNPVDIARLIYDPDGGFMVGVTKHGRGSNNLHV